MTSRHFFRPLLLSAVLVTTSLGAFAQPAGGPPPEGRGKPPVARMDPAKMQERMHKRQDALKARLNLSAGQEAAWNSFVAAHQPPTPPVRLTREEREKRHAEFAAMTTPQRIDQMQAMRARRDAEMQRRADATKSFYAALTPAQQKIFDENSLRGPRDGGHRHGGPGPHQG